MEHRLILLLAVAVAASLLLSGCNAKREVKTAICYAKTQPSEDKCLLSLAIETKDAAPCDKIKTLKFANGTESAPTKVTCYAEVAYRSGEEKVCDSLQNLGDISECRALDDLYIQAARTE